MVLTVAVALLAACGGNGDDRADTLVTATSTAASTESPAATSTHEAPDLEKQPVPLGTESVPTPTLTETPTVAATPTLAETLTTAATPTVVETPTDEPALEQSPTSEPTTPAATPSPDQGDDMPTQASEDTGDDDAKPEDDLAQSLLLEVPELPTGWTLSEVGMDDDDESETDDEEGICGAPPIDAQVEASGEAERSFQASQLGPFAFHLIGLFATEDEAEQAFELTRQAFSCEQWTDVDETGEETVWQISPLSFPNPGDETFAVRINATSDGFAFEGDVIAVRVGRSFMVIQNLGLGAVDSETTIAIVDAAVAKVRAGL